jgi:hypothetical protein
MEPISLDSLGILRPDHYPGDVGFDPLGLKPKDGPGFAKRQHQELEHGRIAMLAAAGCMAQELATGRGILENVAYVLANGLDFGGGGEVPVEVPLVVPPPWMN